MSQWIQIRWTETGVNLDERAILFWLDLLTLKRNNIKHNKNHHSPPRQCRSESCHYVTRPEERGHLWWCNQKIVVLRCLGPLMLGHMLPICWNPSLLATVNGNRWTGPIPASWGSTVCSGRSENRRRICVQGQLPHSRPTGIGTPTLLEGTCPSWFPAQ